MDEIYARFIELGCDMHDMTLIQAVGVLACPASRPCATSVHVSREGVFPVVCVFLLWYSPL